MLVIYDLQEEIKDMKAGAFPADYTLLSPCGDLFGNPPPALSLVEAHGAKSVMISNRTSAWVGAQLDIPALAKVLPGDRITITGRIAHDAPESNWGMVLVRLAVNAMNLDDFVGMAAHLIPTANELFSMSYLIDTADLVSHMRIQCSHWGKSIPNMDYFIDSILITRFTENVNVVADTRKMLYSLTTDPGLPYLNQFQGTSFLQRSGTAQFTMTEDGGRKALHISNRVNNWDTVDINVSALNLLPSNCYEIKVHGRMDGTVPADARVMIQFLPDYIWRDQKFVKDNEEFKLKHILTTSEVQNAEYIRITTDDIGSDLSFFIYEIEIIVNPLIQ